MASQQNVLRRRRAVLIPVIGRRRAGKIRADSHRERRRFRHRRRFQLFAQTFQLFAVGHGDKFPNQLVARAGRVHSRRNDVANVRIRNGLIRVLAHAAARQQSLHQFHGLFLSKAKKILRCDFISFHLVSKDDNNRKTLYYDRRVCKCWHGFLIFCTLRWRCWRFAPRSPRFPCF